MKQNFTKTQILGLCDLTSLNGNETHEDIIRLCNIGKQAAVYALCIYPQYIQTAYKYIHDNNLNLKLATVVNFPYGTMSLERVLKDTQNAITLGIDEIDVVLPYTQLINKDFLSAKTLLKKMREICKNKTLKVIIESGELKESALIEQACEYALAEKVDFIKTSTGKVAINATLAAALVILNKIKSSGVSCGFKAAGGIKTLDDALEYLNLSAEIMGRDWINPQNFRFGVSSLVNNILNKPTTQEIY